VDNKYSFFASPEYSLHRQSKPERQKMMENSGPIIVVACLVAYRNKTDITAHDRHHVFLFGSIPSVLLLANQSINSMQSSRSKQQKKRETSTRKNKGKTML
jgi:hypothetical protein